MKLHNIDKNVNKWAAEFILLASETGWDECFRAPILTDLLISHVTMKLAEICEEADELVPANIFYKYYITACEWADANIEDSPTFDEDYAGLEDEEDLEDEE